MGYMCHNAIIVTSWNKDLLEQAHAKAIDLGMSVSEITAEVTNRYRSFLVAPDGSKEGWDTSDLGDSRRDELVAWMDDQRYEDDSTSLGWVEVQFADENLETRIVRDSDARARDGSSDRFR